MTDLGIWFDALPNSEPVVLNSKRDQLWPSYWCLILKDTHVDISNIEILRKI